MRVLQRTKRRVYFPDILLEIFYGHVTAWSEAVEVEDELCYEGYGFGDGVGVTFG